MISRSFMSPPRRPRARKAIRIAGLVVAGLVIACVSAWGAGLLYFAGPGEERTRAALALVPAVVGLCVIGALFLPRWRRAGLGTFCVMFVLLLIWWSRIEPSNDREWRAEVGRLSHATIDGDLVTVHNIRNFDYRTETDFTPRYYDRTFAFRNTHPRWRRPRLVGVAYDFQQLTSITAAAHDVRMDAVVTDRGVIRCSTG